MQMGATIKDPVHIFSTLIIMIKVIHQQTNLVFTSHLPTTLHYQEFFSARLKQDLQAMPFIKFSSSSSSSPKKDSGVPRTSPSRSSLERLCPTKARNGDLLTRDEALKMLYKSGVIGVSTGPLLV